MEAKTSTQKEDDNLPETTEASEEELSLTEEAAAEESANEANAAEEQLAMLKDQLLRAVAETENVRRRAERQVDDAAKYAVTNFARDLISVLENLYRAGETISPEALDDNPLLKNISEGVEMTKKELLTVFERHGIKRIDPTIGEMFDHNLHQAVAQVPGTGNAAGSIVHVMQAGYIIKDRLLRPAMVAVAKEGE